jgi:hypothetical protein
MAVMAAIISNQSEMKWRGGNKPAKKRRRSAKRPHLAMKMAESEEKKMKLAAGRKIEESWQPVPTKERKPAPGKSGVEKRKWRIGGAGMIGKHVACSRIGAAKIWPAGYMATMA